MSLFMLIAQPSIAFNICLAYDNTAFLNDRTADIIGSAPLLVPGFLTPPGLSGKGQIVGIADSGLDKGSISDIHPDLQSEPGTMPRVAMLKSYSGRAVPDDPNGHGTHMAATIAGSGRASEGQYKGIAPGASLYFQALLDEKGELKIPDNIDDLFNPAYAAGVRIHVNGWGSSGNNYSGNAARIDNFVNLHPDFLPVFGAGNSGSGISTLSNEANSKNALTVGSSQVPRPAFSPEARYADQIANSSSRGPAQDGRIKPELLAPGSAVISACSSLTVSNFQPNSQYTLMGGSSMSAAVTGGSLALLKEYLNIHMGIKNPSSALLKSLLVNGAKSTNNKAIAQEGFGILDLTGAILALQENQFHLVDAQNALHNGESHEYKLNLSKENAPLKATLAWIDPPAASNANPTLVNNLDLIVKDPKGKIYYGNDFLGTGSSDRINNIEQVAIPQAMAGEYTIIVKGSGIDSRFSSQTYALVYGEPLKHNIVQSFNGENRINLAGGAELDLSTLEKVSVVNGQSISKIDQVEAGSDIYLSDKSAYIYGRSWDAGGIQVLSDHGERMLLEINTETREGGLLLDPRVDWAGNQSLQLNDQPLSGIDEIPTGAGVHAALNPGRQTIWQVEAEYDEVQGFIEKLDLEKREIKLVQNNQTYPIKKEAAISYNDRLIDCNDVNIPYGSEETASLEKLAPGMKAGLILLPAAKEVQYITVYRDVVIGEVQSLDDNGEGLNLDTGQNYNIFSGAQLYKDGGKVDASAIKPGTKIAALLLPGTTNIIQLHALSNVTYGRVVYFNAVNRELHIFDNNNQFKTYKLDQAAQVFQLGLQVNTTCIESGRWIRLILDPAGKEVWRIDIAEASAESLGILSSVDLHQKTIKMQDDTNYSYSKFTMFEKGGCRISPDLLVPGDRIATNILNSPYSRASFLARVEVKINPEVQAPELNADAYSLNGVLIIKGNSDADRIILYRSDGSQTDIAANDDGSFSVIYKLQDQESKLRILAMDIPGGGIKEFSLNIREFPGLQGENRFTDISGHPAEVHILNLSQQGIVNGYGDGTFRPEQFISRAEFVTILARAKGWEIEVSTGEPRYFKDNRQISWWATGAVYAARQLGLVNGYPDGSFRPNQFITKSEANMINNTSFGDGGELLTRGEAAELIDKMR